MGETFAIIFTRSCPITEPKIAIMILHHTYSAGGQALLSSKVAKSFAIVFNNSASPGTQPEVAALIFQDVSYIIGTQALLYSKMGKHFAAIFIYASVKSTEP